MKVMGSIYTGVTADFQRGVYPIARIKCNAEVQKAQDIYNGYQQGLEDMLKILRRN